MCQTKRSQRVNRFTGLGDDQDQGALINQRLFISKFRSNGYGNRNSENRFDQGTRHHAGMHGRSARYNVDLIAIFKQFIRDPII